jgi:chromosome segregation ATPase
MHASCLSSCSPSHISAPSVASPPFGGSDFFLLLESEMVKNTRAFKAEIDRISAGEYRLGKEDPLKRQLEDAVESLQNQVSVLETSLARANDEILQLCAQRDSVVSEMESERERLHRVVERLSDENKDLSKQVRDLTSERRETETKHRLEDKYRRALVYIDALQSKLSATPTPPRRPNVFSRKNRFGEIKT